MQVSLNLGTVNIDDQELAKFVKDKNSDELKNIIINLLKKQIKAYVPKNKKGKWGKFADRMSRLTTPEITETIQKASKETRNGFELREVKHCIDKK